MAKTTEQQQASSLLGKTVTATRPMTESGTGSDLTVTGTVVKTMVKSGVNYLGVQEEDGGIVEVKVSDVTAVKSSTSLANYTNMIGKNVFGAINKGTESNPVYTAVSGTVTALFTDNGVNKAQLTSTDGKTYEVELSTISAIKS
jgi:sporulation protein YlmC with PRC-barrel domain